MTSVDGSQPLALSSGKIDHQIENANQHALKDRDLDAEHDVSEEEVRNILEVIVATGKFWHDWNVLKKLLSFRLKQVLADYPESQAGADIGPQPSSSSGETYPELVKRLNGALLSFEEGPPFTLQRLCEILLTPKSIYQNLSKLALALEKNLLVTTTLTISTDPYPSSGASESESCPVHAENGEATKVNDGDEEMVDAEGAGYKESADVGTVGDVREASEKDSETNAAGRCSSGGPSAIDEEAPRSSL